MKCYLSFIRACSYQMIEDGVECFEPYRIAETIYFGRNQNQRA